MRFDRHRRRSRGYTLIEVLVAFVILAMTLAVLLRIFSGGVRNVAVTADYSRAALIAESRLAAAGIDKRLRPGQDSGVDDGRFAWTVAVEPHTPEVPSRPQNVTAWYVTVTVEWSHGERTRKVDLSTVKLQPEGRAQS